MRYAAGLTVSDIERLCRLRKSAVPSAIYRSCLGASSSTQRPLLAQSDDSVRHVIKSVIDAYFTFDEEKTVSPVPKASEIQAWFYLQDFHYCVRSVQAPHS